jgi:hypothetical protein
VVLEVIQVGEEERRLDAHDRDARRGRRRRRAREDLGVGVVAAAGERRGLREGREGGAQEEDDERERDSGADARERARERGHEVRDEPAEEVELVHAVVKGARLEVKEREDGDDHNRALDIEREVLEERRPDEEDDHDEDAADEGGHERARAGDRVDRGAREGARRRVAVEARAHKVGDPERAQLLREVELVLVLLRVPVSGGGW